MSTTTKAPRPQKQDETITEYVRYRVGFALKEQGVTLYWIARESKLDRSNLHKWLYNDGPLGRASLDVLARQLGIRCR